MARAHGEALAQEQKSLEVAVNHHMGRSRAQDVSNELVFRAVANAGCADFSQYFKEELWPRLEALRRRGFSSYFMKNLVWDYSKRRFRAYNIHYHKTTQALISFMEDYLERGEINPMLLDEVDRLNRSVPCHPLRKQDSAPKVAVASIPRAIPVDESTLAPSARDSHAGASSDSSHARPVVAAPVLERPLAPIAGERGDSLSALQMVVVADRSGVVTSLGHSEPTVFWNECRGRIQGAYSTDYSSVSSFKRDNPDFASWESAHDVQIKTQECAPAREISRDYFNFLNSTLPKCLAQALKVPESRISQVQVLHIGIAGSSSHSPRSLHSILRAMDLVGFEIQVAGESRPRRYKASMYSYINKRVSAEDRTPAMKEQDEFWKNFLSCASGSGAGILDYEFNSAHEGHVHFSLPTSAKGFMGK
jgi:hypothetical protein